MQLVVVMVMQVNFSGDIIVHRYHVGNLARACQGHKQHLDSLQIVYKFLHCSGTYIGTIIIGSIGYCIRNVCL